MRILKLFILSVTGLLWWHHTAAQTEYTSVLVFDEQTWDFGTIGEKDGQVSHRFTFRNTGPTALTIDNVAVSCGCTTPSFPREPIGPGKTGVITIAFNPLGQAGAVRKAVTVVSGGGVHRNLLNVRGEVTAKPRTIEEDYPFVLRNGLRFTQLNLNFRYVQHGTVKSMSVGVVNTSDRPVRLAFETLPPTDLVQVAGPQTVAPGAREEITVTYDLRESDIYGRFLDRIYPVVDGHREALPINTTMIAVDLFGPLDDAKAPVINISPSFTHFGDAKKGDVLTCTFTLSNHGSATLHIRWVSGSEQVRTDLREGTAVEPGESLEFEVTYDLRNANYGLYTRSLSIISNDPRRAMREIRLAANVE